MFNCTGFCAHLGRRMLTALAALAAITTVAGAESRLPPDLAQAVLDHEQATKRNDIPTLAELVAEDYLLVNSDSSLQNKEQYLNDFRVPGFSVNKFAMDETVHKVWGDTALTGGVLHLAWTLEGERTDRMLRIAHFWTKQDGRWRLVYSQLTRIPD